MHFDDGCDPTASAPVALERGTSRLADFDEIVKNSVGHVLVEDALVAELLQVELETLQLHALGVRHVSEDQRSEIRLAGFGAHRSEFGAFNFDFVVATRETIVEDFELILKRRGHEREFSTCVELSSFCERHQQF